MGPPLPEKPSLPPIPDQFESLSTSELDRLIESVSELKGYLLKDVNLNAYLLRLDDIIKSLEDFKVKLKSINEEKKITNEKLIELQSDHENFQLSQKKMLGLLDKKFSINTLYNSLFQSINELKFEIDDLFNSFILTSQDDESIELFINNYTDLKTLYHLRNSKLQRFKENRISGLYL